MLNWESDGAAVLIAAECVLYRLAEGGEVEIAEGWIKRKCRVESEWVASVEGIIAEEAIERSVDIVGAGFRDDVDGRAACAAEIGGVVAAIHLKFLDGILADREANTARVVERLAAVDGYAVPAAIAAIEGKAALRRLLDAKILIVGNAGGVGDAREQKGESEVVAAINRKVCDVVLRHRVCLAAALRFDHGRRRCDFRRLASRRNSQVEVQDYSGSHVDDHVLLSLRFEARELYGDAVIRRQQASEAIQAGLVAGCGELGAPSDVLRGDGRTGNNRAGRIDHGADDVARGADSLCAGRLIHKRAAKPCEANGEANETPRAERRPQVPTPSTWPHIRLPSSLRILAGSKFVCVTITC